MKKLIVFIGLAFFLTFSFNLLPISASDGPLVSEQGGEDEPNNSSTLVTMTTSFGEIILELAREEAPITVENFLRYSDEGFFNDLIFHRVIAGFMIQGGGFSESMQHKAPLYPPIKNEAENGLKNIRGTIAMARTQNPHSATSQFFINVVDNPSLDYTAGNEGYAVFGRVIEGMEVVDKIAKTPTKAKGLFSDVPRETIVIERVEILDQKK